MRSAVGFPMLADVFAGRTLRAHHVTLNHIFATVSSLPPGGRCNRLSFSIRVQGPLMREPLSPDEPLLRWRDNGRWAWFEVYVPQSAWDGPSDASLRGYLIAGVLESLGRLASGQKRRVPDSEIEALRTLVSAKLEEYRTSELVEPPPGPFDA